MTDRRAEPGAGDLARVTGGRDPVAFLDRALGVIEGEIVPRTQAGVATGNKVFGAAILAKADLATVVTSTNTETGNPLLHGEVQAITEFYALPPGARPPASETIFVATHEPCPLCLSAIAWGGFDNFFYLFSYEDTRDAHGIALDIVMLEEVFGCAEGGYRAANRYWCGWALRDLIGRVGGEAGPALAARAAALVEVYDGLSETYQTAKAEGRGADVPLS